MSAIVHMVSCMSACDFANVKLLSRSVNAWYKESELCSPTVLVRPLAAAVDVQDNKWQHLLDQINEPELSTKHTKHDLQDSPAKPDLLWLTCARA